MPERFAGTVEAIGHVYSWPVACWIAGIQLSEWPQQRVGELWPAMQTELAWHGFGEIVAPLVAGVMADHFPGCVADQLMLSVVMPGREIEPHTDSQPPHWICRVHVPLTSNPESLFVVGGEVHNLHVGCAYRVNTEAVHSVENDGGTPRIHFLFDVKNH